MAPVTDWPLNIINIEDGTFTTGETTTIALFLIMAGTRNIQVLPSLFVFIYCFSSYYTPMQNGNTRSAGKYNVKCSRSKRHRDEN